jgi:predicted negative regulator of RcsB-dependent stress response
MSKTLVLLVLVAWVSGLNPEPKQGAMFVEELAEQLRQSNLGRAILSFAELGQAASQFDFNKLFDAIDELKASMNVGTVW